MANKDFPIKKLFIAERDDSGLVDDVVQQYVDRALKSNARLKKGYLDAPCIEEAVSLGLESLEMNGDTPSGDPYIVNPIYKINVPGYFYRQRFKGEWSSSAVAGVLLAESPKDFGDTAARMVYMAGSDNKVGHANNMYPILPGKHTYAYIVRNKRIRDADAIREWLFVPTVLSASLNICPRDYVSVVGGPTTTYELSGSLAIGDVFTGKWGGSFKSVCGYNVIDEDTTKANMIFLNDDARNRFISDRVSWIKGLCARLSDYGYTEPST